MLNRDREFASQIEVIHAPVTLHYRWILFVALVWILGPSAALVQGQSYLQSVGSPKFSTQIPVENGYIDASNGRLHLEIPMGSYPQRGGRPYNVALMYDSSIWTHAGTASWQATNVPAAYGCTNSWSGWRLATSGHGCVNYTLTTYGYCNGVLDRYDVYSNWSWTAPDGTVHAFPAVRTQEQTDTCSSADNPNSQGWASDGSGFWMAVTGYNWAQVYAPDGTMVAGGAYHGPEDSNGNYVDGSGVSPTVLGDTLGRVLVTTAVNGNTITYTLSNPQGNNTSVYAVKTGTISVHTNFGQSGVTENSSTITVVNEIDLPDGSKYTFGYDSGTTAGHYGLLTSMTLPTMTTGQQITYSWSPYTDSSGSNYVWINTRTTPDSSTAWTYTPHVVTTCGSGQVNCQQTFTVLKPNGDQTIYTSTLNGGAWASEIDSYSQTTTLLEKITQCWEYIAPITNGVCTISTTTGTPATGVQKQVASIILPVPGGTTISQTTQYTLDSYGNTTKIQENSYYTGTLPSTADRTTNISYLNTTAYLNSLILNRPTNVTVTNASGATVAQTLYSYDGSTLASASGKVNHDDTNYPTSNTVRGNVTQIKRLVTGSTYLTNSMTYDMTGQVITSTDSNGNLTTINYTDHYGYGTPPGSTNAHPTTITMPLNISTKYTYYYGTGQLGSSTDPNNQATSFGYDNMGRLLTNSFPDGGLTSVTYNYSGTVYTGAKVTRTINTSQSMVSTGNVDSLGRAATQVLNSDPSGQTTVATAYDSNGRVKTVSNPYRNTSDSTYGLSTPGYDGLDRTTQVTRPDGNIAYSFYGAAVSSNGGRSSQLCSGYGVGYPTLAKDEAAKLRQTWTDGFGRLIEVDEPDPSSGSMTSGAPAATCYAYDLNNNLAQVVQGTRVRTFAYDNLSRVTSATTPESGTTNYYYTTSGGALCAGDISAICRRTDARSITTTYTYDALNRVKYKVYSDSTPSISYYYDQSSWGGLTSQNAIGRLTNGNVWNSNGWITNSNFSYDPMGRPIQVHHWTVAGGDSAAQYAYDLAGEMTSLTYPSGRKVTYQYNNGMQPTQVRFDSFNGTSVGYNYLSGANYAPIGAPTSVTLGSGVTETECYNNRLQPGNMQIASGAFTWLNRTYNLYSSGSGGCTSSSGNNNSNVISIADNLQPNRTQTFGYDNLNRISTAQSAATSGADCWGQSFGYDAWANLLAENVTKCSGTQLSVGVNTQNRITNSGISYDASGDMLTDGVNTYSYDAESRISTLNGTGAAYTYDAEGNRVQKQAGSMTTDYFWSSGQVLAEYNPANVNWSDYIYAGSRRLASSTGSNENSFTNGSFEQGLTNWTPWNGCAAQLQTSSANAHSGSNYVQVSASSGAICSILGSFIPVNPGDHVTFGGWVNLQSGSPLNWNVGWNASVYNSSYVGLTTFGTTISSSSGGWTYETGTFTVPAGVAYVILYAQVYQPSASTVLWVDDGFLSTGTAYYHGDHLGSARVMSDTGGNVMWSATYLPFGQEWNPQATVNHYKFTGYERDAESGNDDTEARYYSSQYGRFLSPDPLGIIAADLTDPQSLNEYTYVEDDPLNLIDPSGLFTCTPVGCPPSAPGDPFGSGGLPTGPFACNIFTNYGGWGCMASIRPPAPPKKPSEVKPPKPKTTKKFSLCSLIPDGETTGVSGSLGGVGGETGTIEFVVNNNTGEVSAFVSGGIQTGWNGGAQGSVFSGYVYGIGNSNANYSGGFTTISGGAGPGGFISHSSGGMTSGPSGIVPNGNVTAVGASLGQSLIPTATGTISATNYSHPLSLGTIGALAAAQLFGSLELAKQFCGK